MPLPDHGTWRFPPVATGGGGWATRVKAADDGTLVCRLDTYQGMHRPPGSDRWELMLVAGGNVDPTLLDTNYINASPWGEVGGYDVAVCASNGAIQALVCMGYVWRTTDRWQTVTRTALAQQPNLSPNEALRMCGAMLEFDPANGDVLWLATPAGVRFTVDGGANWSSIATGTLPAPTGVRAFIAFDRSSAVVGGRTQTLYCYATGVGLYRSTDAGATWAAVAGTPRTDATELSVNPHNGDVWLAGIGSNDGPLNHLSGGVWSNPAGVAAHGVAFSQTNPSHVVAYGESSRFRVSTDGGAVFGNLLAHTRTATDIGWQAVTNEDYMSSGNVIADPLVPDRWHCAEGLGMWRADFNPASDSSVAWQENSLGIENMVTTLLTATPNRRLLAALHDRPFFSHSLDALDRFPTGHGISYAVSIDHGGQADYAPEDPDFIVAVNSRTDAWGGGISQDGGRTWAPMPVNLGTFQGGKGHGNIACLSKTNWIWLPVNQGYPMFTKDGGQTWAPCDINGQRNFGWHNAYVLSRRVLVGDKLTPGRALIYNVGDWTALNVPPSSDTLGIWETLDGGETWTRIRPSLIVGNGQDSFHGQLGFVPGSTTDLFWSGGDNGFGLFRSRDGAVTWAAVAGFSEVYTYAFGPPAPGETYPSILAVGYRSGLFGTWLSVDDCATWTRLADFPAGRFDGPLCAAADPDQFGRFFIGYKGTSLQRAELVATLVGV